MRLPIRIAAAAVALALAVPAAAQEAAGRPAPDGPSFGAYLVWGMVGAAGGLGIGYGVANAIVGANPVLFAGQAGNARVEGAVVGTLMGGFLGVVLTGAIWDAWTPPLNLRVVPSAGAGRGGLALVGRF